MFEALQIAATGMHAQQRDVDRIANNIANVNTLGFKRTRIEFGDLVLRTGGSGPDAAVSDASSVARGAGVAIKRSALSFDAGELRKTDSAYDLTIDGDGFLEVTLADGSRAYSRGGTLRVNAEGQLATSAGQALAPGIAVPDDATTLTIGRDGRVLLATPRHQRPYEAGRLELVRFAGPAALDPLGDGLFRANADAGEPISGRAGEDGFGTFRQGFLETSNVKLVEEMVNLMIAQRAYEASVKVAQASDEMLGLVNGLRR